MRQKLEVIFSSIQAMLIFIYGFEIRSCAIGDNHITHLRIASKKLIGIEICIDLDLY